MNQLPLETELQNLRAPEPDPNARLAAKRAAIAEFARIHAGQKEQARPRSFQGLWQSLRLTRALQRHGRINMNWATSNTFLSATAAVCVAVIGFFITRPMILETPWPTTETVQREVKEIEPTSPKSEATPTARLPSQTEPPQIVELPKVVAERPAQQSAATQRRPRPQPAQPEEIVVTGLRGHLQASMDVKRQAVGVVDSISSESIGKYPDSNVAEALQRVPGTSVEGGEDESQDTFEHFEINPVVRTADAPVSTFSADVDTASYSYVRAEINSGVLPDEDAVRAEEMINYFDYSWPAPRSRDEPFKPTIVVTDSPWNEGKKLIHIGIKGYELPSTQQPDANLVLLLDVSGSMNEPNKLPLVKQSMKLLVSSLKPTDTVAIVVYAGAAGTVLEPTEAKDKEKIFSALDSLHASGSTAGAEGIERAYELAESRFRKEGVNRVVLATDGDFNVGITDTEELKHYVERQREKGVFLSVLGFGQGNYRDELAQALAQNGNGVAAYIDTLNEAQKVLVREATSSLFTIAKDVKFQVEFNPATVAEYRLVGYETRILRREDFNNDAVDAGDVGSGHAVTVIYEITPVASKSRWIDESRYVGERATRHAAHMREYGNLKIRFKLPDETRSKLIQAPIFIKEKTASAPIRQDVQFSTAVAGYAQLLHGAKYTGKLQFEDVVRQAESSRGDDPYGYRTEFVELVKKTQSVSKE